MHVVATKRFGKQWLFETKQTDFAEAVWLSTQVGVVLILASQSPGQIGHAYHLLGGSFPLADRDLPPFIANLMRRQDDLLEHVRLWDPWTGATETANRGSVRQRFERAGSQVLLMAPRARLRTR